MGARRPRRDAGMVTAETALVLPALVLVLVGAVWLLCGVIAQVRCVDAAREGARVAARGDGDGRAVAAARAAAPAGAAVHITRGAGQVRVTVRATVAPFGGWAGRLPPVRLAATAAAVDEAVPGAAGP